MAIATNCLTMPQDGLPSMLDFFQTAPCTTCDFLQPLLSNNYLSFYSTIYEEIELKKMPNPAEENEYILGAQVVSDSIYKKLSWEPVQKIGLVFKVVVYLTSITVLLFMLTKRMIDWHRERLAVEVFLKFFPPEVLQSNKLVCNLLT